MFFKHTMLMSLSKNMNTYPCYVRSLLFSSSSRNQFEVKKVGVVGLGLMGHGVAQVTSQTGYEVIAIETNKDALDTGIKRIKDSLGKVMARSLKKGEITEAQGVEKIEEVISRITPTIDMNAARDCDIIVEAIAENMDLKLDFYKKLGSIIDPKCIFASNTSSLQITAMGEASARPERFAGLHFFNPVQIMKLVEVIRTEKTSDDTYRKLVDYSKAIGKTVVTCGDTPGFIVNRLLVPYLAQAMAMVDRKVASVPDIDVSMQLGAGHPMGPLHLADYIGLDTCLSILVGWRKDFPDETAFILPDVLVKLVGEGHMGRKSGAGFYEWDGDRIGKPRFDI